MVNRFDHGIFEHERVAPFYGYRPNYFPNLFLQLSQDLPLKPDQTVLDLGCGQGQVAIGLVPYVKRIIGIDGSRSMLTGAKQHPQIEYRLADINDTSFWPTGEADHVFMGMSAHWINLEALKFVKHNGIVEKGAFVSLATFVSAKNSFWGLLKPQLTPYKSIFDSLIPSEEISGQRKLAQLGMFPKRVLEGSDYARVTPDQIAGYLVSTAYGNSYALIQNNLKDFKARISLSLKSICDDSGTFVCRIDNWAVIYR